MKGLLRTRLHMGRQTIAFPDGPARFPERFRGRPALSPQRCAEGCRACVEACPTDAILIGDLANPHGPVGAIVDGTDTVRLREELGNEPKVYYRS